MLVMLCSNVVVHLSDQNRVLVAQVDYYMLRVVHAAVSAHAHFTNYRRLEVHEDPPGHVFAGRCLREEGVERVVLAADGLVRRHHAVRLDAVLEAVQL